MTLVIENEFIVVYLGDSRTNIELVRINVLFNFLLDDDVHYDISLVKKKVRIKRTFLQELRTNAEFVRNRFLRTFIRQIFDQQNMKTSSMLVMDSEV